jgi:hypothetical protein
MHKPTASNDAARPARRPEDGEQILMTGMRLSPYHIVESLQVSIVVDRRAVQMAETCIRVCECTAFTTRMPVKNNPQTEAKLYEKSSFRYRHSAGGKQTAD